MDLATIEMPVEEAQERLAEYEAMIASERTAEDDAIAAGYRAAARGLPVIQLSKVMAAGGYFDNGLPRLAIIRADATVCHVRIDRHQSTTSMVFGVDRFPDNRGALVGQRTVRVTVEGRAPAMTYGGETIVPTIPPGVRPKKRRMHTRHILWEVEAWSHIVPKDPALLRHIRGDLWAVLATWDLTELERAVLSQRR